VRRVRQHGGVWSVRLRASRRLRPAGFGVRDEQEMTSMANKLQINPFPFAGHLSAIGRPALQAALLQQQADRSERLVDVPTGERIPHGSGWSIGLGDDIAAAVEAQRQNSSRGGA